MNKHALYNGRTDSSLIDIIEHGLKSNKGFVDNLKWIIDKILISRNQLNRHSESPFYDFNYPNYETCKELINNDKYSDVDFIIILFDWCDLYDEKRGLSDVALELAHYLKRPKYIKEKKEIEDENENIINSQIPREVGMKVNTNLIFDKLDVENIDIRIVRDTYKDYYKKKTFAFNSYDYIHKIPTYLNPYIPRYTKYEIVNDFDKAYYLYENGDRSNEVLSKLFSEEPDKYDEYMGESEFFLVFARHDIDCRHIKSKKYHKFKYNILYINILFPNSTQPFEEYIDIPEYNLYVAAVKMNNKSVIKKLLEFNKEHGKFYKKMDLEKQVYIDEEIYEIPEIEPLNLITGDILNPYHELKKV
ncbi:hypothetical protein CLIB1423_06S06172 [[Candida] railenensis]|uniref:Uncharacterized protein n=1 Tax=[Candida] railenensis TaxID=45579 RepID=A0A9P0QPD7_9ASCO|nr:hypothetical protein CLIB1423_06S06172 [[Candida] railenensis]